MRLHFDQALVRQLLDHSKAATERSPSYDQLYEGRFRRDGKDADLDTLGSDNFPTADDVDPTKIPAGLWLVGDQGVYLMSNGKPALLVDPADTRHVVAHAAEANPAAGIEAWWDVKRAAFGGDDGVVFLELPFAEGLLARARDGRVCVDLTPTQAEAVTPYPTRSLIPPAVPAPRRPAPSRRAGRA